MKDDRFFALIVVITVVLIVSMFLIVLIHTNNADVKLKCIASNKTYLEFSDQASVISVHYCGDIAEIKSLIEQAGGVK